MDTWRECDLVVDAVPVHLRVEYIEGAERERIALTMAWTAITSGAGPDAARTWMRFVADVLPQHVAFEIDPGRLAAVPPDFWTHATTEALAQFLRVNALMPDVHHHIARLRALEHRARMPL